MSFFSLLPSVLGSSGSGGPFGKGDVADIKDTLLGKISAVRGKVDAFLSDKLGIGPSTVGSRTFTPTSEKARALFAMYMLANSGNLPDGYRTVNSNARYHQTNFSKSFPSVDKAFMHHATVMFDENRRDTHWGQNFSLENPEVEHWIANGMPTKDGQPTDGTLPIGPGQTVQQSTGAVAATVGSTLPVGSNFIKPQQQTDLEVKPQFNIGPMAIITGVAVWYFLIKKR